MLFKLPIPPAGQAYVNKVTANGPTTVLVDKASLSEDVCTATGRTWAEEARLYNIRNAPDGKQISEPGDPLYQTADSMKNRNKELGGISAKILANFNQVAGTAPGAPLPNLSETMEKIKGGQINADITASLGKIGDVAGSLPSELSGPLDAAKAEIAAKMADAQAQLPKLLAMAQANVDILTKKKIAETGQPPTEAEIKAAQGALTIFQDGPKLLESKAAEVSKAVAEAGTGFGATLSAGLSSAKDFAKAGLDKVTDLAKTAGAKISEFASGVPAETIPNPEDPEGPAIPNPAFAAFSAISGNASKLAGLTDIKNVLAGATTDLASKFSAIEEVQATAVAGGMADLKAFAFAAQLSQPATGFKSLIQDFTLDKSAFDPASISQTFAIASKLGPSIDTSLYKSTKDEDLTYKGDDGIVWDRTNAERLRRSLPGLAAIGSPRPLDPPLVPAGPTPPKDPTTTSTPIVKEVSTETSTAPPKVASTEKIMGQEPGDKIYKAFLDNYRKILLAYDTLAASAEKAVKATDSQVVPNWFLDADDIGYPALNKKSKKIKDEKKEVSDRTDEEKLIVKEQTFYRDLYVNNSQFFLYYRFNVLRRNQLAEQYNILLEAFNSGKTFADLPPSVEDGLKLDPNPKSVYPVTYASFGEFRRANPDKAKFIA
jgi:hypothetical protein